MLVIMQPNRTNVFPVNASFHVVKILVQLNPFYLSQDDLHGTDYTGSDEKRDDEKHGGYHSDSSQSLSYSSDGEKDNEKPTKASIKKQAAIKQDTKGQLLLVHKQCFELSEYL